MRKPWVPPANAYLRSYTSALACGWQPQGPHCEDGQSPLAAIQADTDRYLATLTNLKGHHGVIARADGTTAPGLPHYERWMWDGEFSGTISLRWQPASNALPDMTQGHILFSVVPWKQGRGYATAALGALLPEAREQGLDYVDLVTEPYNRAAQQVILTNAGQRLPPEPSSQPLPALLAQRYRIYLDR